MAVHTGTQLPVTRHSQVEAQAPHEPLRPRHHVLFTWFLQDGLGESPQPHMLEA